MTRKTGREWSPLQLPSVRDRQADGLRAWVRGQRRLLANPDHPADGSPADRVLERKRISLGIDAVSTLADGVQSAALYWVSRDMTRLATQAAGTLPPWTPLAAVPCPMGLLAWATPASTPPLVSIDEDGRKTFGERRPFHAAMWALRPDGLTVEIMTHIGGTPPLAGLQTIRIPDPDQPRTAEQDIEGSDEEEAAPELSILASAWLLMGQPTVASVQRRDTTEGVTRADGGDTTPATVSSSTCAVSIRRVNPPEMVGRAPIGVAGGSTGTGGNRPAALGGPCAGRCGSRRTSRGRRTRH